MIGSLPSLDLSLEISIDNNFIHGSIPSIYSNTDIMFLSNNLLTDFSAIIENNTLSEAGILNLDRNKLSGTLPSSFKNFKNFINKIFLDLEIKLLI